MLRRSISTAMFTMAVVIASAAQADVSRNVITAFRGQLVLTDDELPEGKTDKDTIAKIKAARLKELTGTAQDDVTAWHFHYAAFLNKTGAKSLKLEFITTDKEKRLAADKHINDVDPKSGVLLGEISINEDEGLAKGKTYTLNLVNAQNQVVSSTPVTMK
jgi:hypothetical protein